MPLGNGGRPQPRRLCVRWGPSSRSRKRGWSTPAQFSAHVYCDQMAAWIKMPFGMEVGLSSGDIVLDGNPASPKSCTAPASFWSMSIVAKWLDG